MFNINRKCLIYGIVLWIAATILLRFAGHRLLHPGNAWSVVALFFISFLLMAGVARRLCARLQLPPHQWPAAAISLALPTLLLDPFSSAFFASVFPNMTPAAAGLFGGWMLCCCGGALTGGVYRR